LPFWQPRLFETAVAPPGNREQVILLLPRRQTKRVSGFLTSWAEKLVQEIRDDLNLLKARQIHNVGMVLASHCSRSCDGLCREEARDGKASLHSCRPRSRLETQATAISVSR
jgi:hypothetical protein